jgi:hypothetical protein
LKPTITKKAALTPMRILTLKKNFKTRENPSRKRNKKRSKKVRKKR